MDFTIKCQFAECDKSFHAVCGLFGDCHLSAHRVMEGNGFESTFYCKTHKYLKKKEKKTKLHEINVDNLGMHVLQIKKLQAKLDKIKLTQERVDEYELLQRGIVNESANAYKHKRKKHRDRDRKMKSRKRSKSKSRLKKKRHRKMEIDDDDDENEKEAMEFSMRTTRSQSTKNLKVQRKDEQIRMATDIWAEQYRYAGGEIKWPIIKRNGWFLSIPRLKLPKGNKFRYSHKERRAKQELIQKEKEKNKKKYQYEYKEEQNVQWNMFMDAIKEREAELQMDKNNQDGQQNKKKIIRRQNAKYIGMVGEDWEFVEHCQGISVDAETCKVCPLCKKTKHTNVSKPNWQKHLNAKHQFRCKKCKLMFTRHPQLTQHLEQCNA